MLVIHQHLGRTARGRKLRFWLREFFDVITLLDCERIFAKAFLNLLII